MSPQEKGIENKAMMTFIGTYINIIIALKMPF